jgi:hypothetical protein
VAGAVHVELAAQALAGRPDVSELVLPSISNVPALARDSEGEVLWKVVAAAVTFQPSLLPVGSMIVNSLSPAVVSTRFRL